MPAQNIVLQDSVKNATGVGVATQFCFFLMQYARKSLGSFCVKGTIKESFAHAGANAAPGSDGFPLMEETDVNTQKALTLGLSLELRKRFGIPFTKSVLQSSLNRLSRQFSVEAISEQVLPLIPSDMLDGWNPVGRLTANGGQSAENEVILLREKNAELEEKLAEHFRDQQELIFEQERAAHILVRRDSELTRANDQLRKLDEAKSGFISVVAHQLRTPLSGIKWTLNLLINGDLGVLTTEQKTFLMKAYESNDRMISLVNDMLGADRIESGKVRYEFQPLQIIDIVDNVLFELLPQANARGVSVAFISKPPHLPKIRGDAEKIRAVFQNLLDNAIKYSKPHGTIQIGLLPKNGTEVEVRIQDDGIGIPTDQQRNIFHRFFRAQNAVKLETDGSGLGLFIVKSIVERHGGKIWFESEEGKGVTFFFTLPVDTGERQIGESESFTTVDGR